MAAVGCTEYSLKMLGHSGQVYDVTTPAEYYTDASAPGPTLDYGTCGSHESDSILAYGKGYPFGFQYSTGGHGDDIHVPGSVLRRV